MKNLLISFLFCLCFSEEIIDGVVAVVGENIITKGDYFYQLSSIANQRGISPSLTPLKYERLASSVLEQTIDRYVFLEFAKKDSNIVIENEEVQQQLDSQINMFVQSVGSIDSLEVVFGKPIQKIKADYWEEIYNAMLIERFKFFLTGGISVGKKEVELFYEEYKDSLPPSPANANFTIYNTFFEPSKTTISSSYSFVSSLRDSASLDVDSFNNLIALHSEDYASLPTNGIIGFTERGSLFPEYEETAYSMSVGEISTPVKTEAGHHLIKLLDRRGDKIKTQHLLRRIVATEKDKEKTIKDINNVFNRASLDPLFLETLVEEREFNSNSLSGNYNMFPILRLPDDVYKIINNSKDSFLHEPMMMQDGSIFILYVYEVFQQEKATLNNSYEFIESIALDKKSIEYLNSWLDINKPKVYINTFE